MSDGGMTYDVRVYRTEVYKGSEVTTYRVRWKVGVRLWREGFRTAAQADSFRSALMTAARKGEAFSLVTGRPTAWERAKADTSWYEFACAYVGHEVEAGVGQVPQGHRPGAVPRPHRRCWPKHADGPMMRASAGRSCGRHSTPSSATNPPADVAEVLAWVARNSAPGVGADRRRDGQAGCSTRPLAAWTARTRPRARPDGTARSWPTPWTTRSSCGLLDTNPIRALKWTAPKVSSQVDRRCVVNPRQARALLDAVRAQQPSGPRLVAFFAVMYYAGLRPEEAHQPRQDNLVLPSARAERGQPAVARPARRAGLGRAASAQRNPRRRQRVDR